MVSAKEKNGISLPEMFVDDDLSDSISPLAQVHYRRHKVPNTIKKMEKEKGSSHCQAIRNADSPTPLEDSLDP